MIDLFEMYENEGIKKGVRQGVRQGMRQGVRKGVRKGVKKGLEKGIRKGIRKGSRAVICDNRDNHVPKEMIIQKLIRLFEISREEAETFYLTGDGVNVRRTLAGSQEADLMLELDSEGVITVIRENA